MLYKKQKLPKQFKFWAKKRGLKYVDCGNSVIMYKATYCFCVAFDNSITCAHKCGVWFTRSMPRYETDFCNLIEHLVDVSEHYYALQRTKKYTAQIHEMLRLKYIHPAYKKYESEFGNLMHKQSEIVWC